ncbi:hypothetical protein J4Q44_G00163820 [Coregonus suidteri]|uniref:Uncharacterized protein n=1 Tax=Coregonus suidteri TaxID=861788 RepID=A0AAN8LK29_9TELE
MDIFNTHGSPEVILSDRGRELWNKERWEYNLKVILFAHNSFQVSTEYSPYRLLYGREPQLLTEITEIVESDQNAFEDHLQARAEKDVEVFYQVRLNIDKLGSPSIKGYIGGSQQSSPVGRSTTESPDSLHIRETHETNPPLPLIVVLLQCFE